MHEKHLSFWGLHS